MELLSGRGNGVKVTNLKRHPLVVITGPTATGKSRVGVLVAKIIGGEIISADSMLVYRGMDIGTAKPTRDEMCGIPHHLIDIVNPNEDYNVALFQAQARALIKDIIGRNKLPVLVGGTGLYIRAVIDNYDFSSPGNDGSIRNSLLKEAMKHGSESLYQTLSEVDPGAALKLHPRDTRRIIRALEVYRLTGKPISSYHRVETTSQTLYNLLMYGLNMDRDRLYQQIEHRVDQMITAGLVDEVRGLLNKGFSPDLKSMRGLGYKEILEHLTGVSSLEQATEVLKRNTRRFAKRQLTWFRRDQRINWFNVDEYNKHDVISQEISSRIEGVLKGL